MRIKPATGPVALMEAPDDVLCSRLGIISSRIIAEVVAQWILRQHVPKGPDIAQEQYYGGGRKSHRVNHRVKKIHRFRQLGLIRVISASFIVRREIYDEHDGSHVVKLIEPLLPLRSLLSNVDDVDAKSAHCESGFEELLRASSRLENVGFAGHIVRLGNSLYFVEEAAQPVRTTI